MPFSNINNAWFFLSVVTCPTLSTTITGGTVSGSVFTYGKQVTFICSTGYYITGAGSQSVTRRVLTCMNNGQWNGSAATCSRELEQLLKYWSRYLDFFCVLLFCPEFRGLNFSVRHFCLINNLTVVKSHALFMDRIIWTVYRRKLSWPLSQETAATYRSTVAGRLMMMRNSKR